MSYGTFEGSQETGSPIEVYRFTIGAQSFFYTSAESDQTVAALNYTAIGIQRSKLEEGPEKRDSTLTITVPTPNEVAQLFIIAVLGIRVRIEIDRFHRLDTPTPEVVRIFDGFVQSASYVDNMKTAKLSCRPAIATLGRTVPRITYQAACSHVLYDGGCKIDDTLASYRASNKVVTGDVGSVLTIAGLGGSYTDGWFDGGYVEVLGGTDYRLVLSHTGDNLTLFAPFTITPSIVNVFAGCGHSIDVCKSKFDNVGNFGGFAFVPTKNPFQTGLD